MSDRPIVGIVDIAGARIALSAAHGRAKRIVNAVLSELGEGNGEGPVVGRVDVVNGPLPPLPGAVGISNVQIAEEAVEWHLERSGMSVRVHLDPGMCLSSASFRATVTVGIRPMPKGVPRPAFRWLEPTFHRPSESQAYVFIPMVLESLVFFASELHVPLHAAGVERNGRAVLLTSAGGVGKTSTAMALVGSGRWNYLTDDMTMLAADGRIHPYRRLPMVYEYNLRANPSLRRRVVRSRGPADRLQWYLTRPLHGGGRRRRLAPGELYGRPVVGSTSGLDTVAFLCRSDTVAVNVRPLSADELARRSVAILATEFEALLRHLRFAEALGSPPMVDPLLRRAHSSCRAVFERCETLIEVRIPNGHVPGPTVARAIEEHAGA